MTRATPDPTRWLTDLLESGHLALACPRCDGRDEGHDGRDRAVDEGRRRPHRAADGDVQHAHQRVGGDAAHRRRGADRRPPVRRRGVDEGPALRGRRPHLPRPDRPAAQGPRRRAAGRAHQGAVGLRARPGDGRAQPGEHAGHQPGGHPAGAGVRRQEPRRGDAPLHRGPRAGPHRDDRRVGVRGGPQRRHHAGHGRAAERAHAADPVHADHDAGLQAPAGDRAAVASTSTTSSTCSPRTPSSPTRSPKGTRCSWCPGATWAPSRAP